MADPEIDASLVRELADILSDTGLTEIEVERGELRIRVARMPVAAAAVAPVMVAAPAAAAAVPIPNPQSAIPTTEPSGEQVKSPMVGTAYLQAKPGDAPFVTPGTRVVAGQTLLIIEAMKTMNPVPAPRDGVVSAVLIGDSQPVEYGEPLVTLE